MSAGSVRRTPPGVFPDGDSRFTARWVVGDGWQARCIESGPPDGRPLVMLPGFGCSAFTFRQNMPAFAAAGWRVIAVEPPGQGWSDKPDDARAYTLEGLARNVSLVLDRLAVRSAPVIGQSLGGGIALQLAMDAPSKVERLALWSPVGFGCTRLVHVGAMLPVESAPALQKLVTPWVVRSALEVVFGSSRHPTDEEVQQYYAPIPTEGFVRSQIELLRNVNWDPISAEDRRKVTQPVLILTGTEDRLVPLRCLADAAETLPDCHLHTLPGAGHGPNETHPDQVNRETLAFVGLSART